METETFEFDMALEGGMGMDLSSFWHGNDFGLDSTFETDWQEFERITSQI